MRMMQQEMDGTGSAGAVGPDGQLHVVESYSARTARKRVLDLWESCWSEAQGEKRDLAKKFDWFYDGNPAGDTIVYELRSAEKAIGMTVESPRRFLFNGEPVSGGTIVDFVINPRNRTFYPAKILQRKAHERILVHHDFAFGIPNERATRFMQKAKLGMHEINRPYMTTVLRTAHYLRRYLKGWLAAPAGVVLDAMIRWRDAIARLLLPALRGQVQSGFDARFDDLWRRTNVPGLIGVRDREFLTWRFQNQPGKRHTVLAITRPGQSGLRGYFVLVVDNDVMSVRDMLCPGSWAEQASAWFLLRRTARRMGVRTITCHIGCSSAARRAMAVAGFRERGRMIIFFRPLAEEKFASARQTTTWHVTEADEDI